MSHVLIAGCGDLGARIGRRFRELGDDVWGLRRSASAIPAEFQPIVADLTDPDTLRDLPPALDRVVYAVSAGGFAVENYRAAYVDGVRNLLDALDSRDPFPTFLFISSTSVYGQRDGEWVDEDSATAPEHFSGTTMLEGEELAKSVGGTAFRLAGIYGPGRTRLLDRVRAGDAKCTPTENFLNLIHVEDAAQAVVHIADRQDRADTYNVVDNAPTNRNEVITWLATQLGLPEPPIGDDPNTASRVFRTNKRTNNTQLRTTRFEPQYPTYKEGYAELLEGS